MAENNTTQAQISFLDFPECVRQRVGIYLMDPNHCVDEVVDNSVDEAMAGRCDTISVYVNPEKLSASVLDNGGGIPITPHSDPAFKGKPQAEVAMTVLHAGGKFGKDDGYVTATGGQHGVGASCVNAVSTEFEMNIYTGGKEYLLGFKKGVTTSKLSEIGQADKTGTKVTFTLDREIWLDEVFDLKRLEKRLQQIAYMNPGLTIRYEVEGQAKPKVFCYKDGLKEYMRVLTSGKECITPILYNEKEADGIKVTAALAWTTGYSQDVYSFVNNISTPAGGDHVTGLKTGLSKAVETVMGEGGFLKASETMESDDAREGVVAIVSIKMKNAPRFEGQGKTKLKMPAARSAVNDLVREMVMELLHADDSMAKAVAKKVSEAIRARIAAKKARDAIRGIKAVSSSVGSLPGKLADCTSKRQEETEIYIVEGDSAGGSAKQGRNRHFQAILPLRGKILNAEKSTLDKIVNSEMLRNISSALRYPLGEDKEVEDVKQQILSKIRYGKIIILTDADLDGGHIRTLILTFIYRYMRPLVDAGMVYLAQPPLYILKKGKETHYVADDAALEDFFATRSKDGWTQNYLKGLGEMDPSQLWDSTLNPDTRTLVRVVVDDVEETESYISVCMGDNVAARRDFIFQSMASEAEAS